MTAGGKPLTWTKNNLKCSVDLDGPAFLAGVYMAFLSGWALPNNVGEHICPGVFIAATNLADGICMNLVVPSLCCLYSSLWDIVEVGLGEGRIGEKLVYLPLQYFCAWLELHFPSISQRGEKNFHTIVYVNTLKNQQVEMVLRPATLFCFTHKLVLISDHLFSKQTLVDDGLLAGETWGISVPFEALLNVEEG